MVTGTVREHEGGHAGGFVQAFAFHFLVKCAPWLQKPDDTQYLLSVSGNQILVTGPSLGASAMVLGESCVGCRHARALLPLARQPLPGPWAILGADTQRGLLAAPSWGAVSSYLEGTRCLKAKLLRSRKGAKGVVNGQGKTVMGLGLLVSLGNHCPAP